MFESDREELHELLGGFHSGMLVTRTPEGTLRARPMTVAKVDDLGDVFLATSIQSDKIDEIERDHQVVLTFQSSMAYVTLSGPARVVTDAAIAAAAWTEGMRVWFPAGPQDPELCLIQLRPLVGEYWNMRGMKGIRTLYEAAKAYVSGTTPPSVPGVHGVVDP
jgi:general stress protein 26